MDTIYFSAQRYSLFYQPVDFNHSNVMQCPICKRLITDMAKPWPLYRLNIARELGGVKMCIRCAGELDHDIKNGKSIESILEKYK